MELLKWGCMKTKTVSIALSLTPAAWGPLQQSLEVLG